MAVKQTYFDGNKREIDVTYETPLPVAVGRPAPNILIRSTVTVGSSIALKLLNANENRRIVVISNLDMNKAVFVKFQAASVDNLKTDICIKPADPPFVLKASDGAIYTGEISVIADSGTVEVTAVELSAL